MVSAFRVFCTRTGLLPAFCFLEMIFTFLISSFLDSVHYEFAADSGSFRVLDLISVHVSTFFIRSRLQKVI